jgi:hypothetical protein
VVEIEKKRWLKKRAKVRNGKVRTYTNVVNVAFTRTASARLAAPASPIWFSVRLEGSPEHTTTPHADGRS